MNNVTTIFGNDTRPCDTEPPTDSDLIPQKFIDCGLIYFSPSQLKQPLHYWLTDRFLLDPETKKKKKQSVPARFGSAIHKMVQDSYILGEDLKQILIDIESELKTRTKNYDNKDFYKVAEYKKKLFPVYENVVDAFEILKIEKCDLETPIDLSLRGVDIPINGYTDFRTDTHVIELKTKWNRVREVSERYNVYRVLKNGQWSKSKRVFKDHDEVDEYVAEQDCDTKVEFIDKHFECDSPPIVKEPYKNDLLQLALYSKATGLKPVIVYATEKDFKIFNQDNCELLSQESLDNYVEKARRIALSRQNLIKMVDDPHQLIDVIEPPDISEFWYDLGQDVVNEVKHIWNL